MTQYNLISNNSIEKIYPILNVLILKKGRKNQIQKAINNIMKRKMETYFILVFIFTYNSHFNLSHKNNKFNNRKRYIYNESYSKKKNTKCPRCFLKLSNIYINDLIVEFTMYLRYPYSLA